MVSAGAARPLAAGDRPSVEERLRLLEVGEQVAKLGTWEWLPRPDVLLWSDNLYRIFGLEPGEITPARQFVLEQTHPQDRERVARYVEMTRDVSDPPPIEYRIQQPGGGVRYLRSTIVRIEAGARGATRIVGAVQDVTDQRMTSREIAAHVAVAGALSDWNGFDDGAVQLLRALGKACQCVVGALWVPSRDLLLARALWSDPDLEITDFAASTFALRLALGAGLPGRVWQSKQPEALLDASAARSYRRRDAARRTSLRGAFAFPAVKGQEVLAVLEFYSHDADLTDRLGQTLRAIGNELGEFFSRRRGQLAPPLLTKRELEVLELAALGNTTAQIAESLRIGVATAKTHLENSYRKLRVPDRSAAVARALRLGMID